MEKQKKHIQVSIIMGSKSDWNIMQSAKQILDEFLISNEAVVLSAHRTPEALLNYIKKTRKRRIANYTSRSWFFCTSSRCLCCSYYSPDIRSAN